MSEKVKAAIAATKESNGSSFNHREISVREAMATYKGLLSVAFAENDTFPH